MKTSCLHVSILPPPVRSFIVTIIIDIPKKARSDMIRNIKKFAQNEAIEFTLHAREKMYERGISSLDVKQSLLEGEIIEEYLDDHPYPSFLLCAKNRQNYLHVVCAVAEEQLFIITTYQPDEDKWLKYRRRK
jgi:hypothetical protein